MRLEGKVALITGAAPDIGARMASSPPKATIHAILLIRARQDLQNLPHT
jgi:short-subunit dehydrogenase